MKSRPPSPPKRIPPALGTDATKNDGINDWEIDNNQLKLGQKVASGAFGDL
jgi:hypothetical protein